MKVKISIVIVLSLILITFLGIQTSYAAPVVVDFRDLGTLGGHTSYAYGINELGQVVGKSYKGDGSPECAFVWTETEGMKPLDRISGLSSFAHGINNLGQAVGGQVMIINPYTVHAVLWDVETGAVIDDVGSIGSYCQANDINDNGQIVGYDNGLGAFLWTEGNGQVSLFGDTGSQAFAINQSGQVIGPSPLLKNAFLWSIDTGPIGIFDENIYTGSAQDINDMGQVVGHYKTGILDPNRAYIWSLEEGMVDIGTLGGDNSAARACNNYGQVVGTSNIIPGSSAGHAFVWSEEYGMVDLSLLIGNVNIWPWDINDAGQITGYYLKSGEGYRAFRCTIGTPHIPPEDRIDELIGMIDDLINSDVLNKGQGNAFTSKLDAAKKKVVEDGQDETAINGLEAFINQVGAFIQSGKLTSKEGQSLIYAANAIIEQLSS